MNVDLLVTEVTEAFDIFVDGLRNVGKILMELLECFCEEEEKEKTHVSSSKQYGILLKNVSHIRTKSYYRQPYVQVPRHLAYQKRHYQS